VNAPDEEAIMVRKTTRRSPRTTAGRTASRRTASRRSASSASAAARRGKDGGVVTGLFEFLTKRLPQFLDDEFEQIRLARSESEMFQELSKLPDSELRKAGLRREDLPRFVLSCFNLINMTRDGRRSQARRRARSAPAKRAA
jgi:hypothetical protein